MYVLSHELSVLCNELNVLCHEWSVANCVTNAPVALHGRVVFWNVKHFSECWIWIWGRRARTGASAVARFGFGLNWVCCVTNWVSRTGLRTLLEYAGRARVCSKPTIRVLRLNWVYFVTNCVFCVTHWLSQTTLRTLVEYAEPLEVRHVSFTN